MMLKIGLVGCGAIGTFLAQEICQRPDWQLVGLFDISEAQVQKLQTCLPFTPPFLTLDSLVKKADVIVEAASVAAVPPLVELAEKYQRQLVVISVGAFLLYPKLGEQVRQSALEVFISSGALAGLDALKAAAQKDIESVQLITRKPACSVAGAPYILAQGIDLAKITSPTVIFQGNAKEAVAAFPQNINVAAAISLAGIGPERTEIILEVSPTYTTNSHELLVKGAFGSFSARTENRPFPQNPKTSFLAALSILTTINNLTNPIKIGN